MLIENSITNIESISPNHEPFQKHQYNTHYNTPHLTICNILQNIVEYLCSLVIHLCFKQDLNPAPLVLHIFTSLTNNCLALPSVTILLSALVASKTAIVDRINMRAAKNLPLQQTAAHF